MSTQLQLRRGNTAQTAVFTGAIGEVTVDTDQKTLTVHDGSTIGGNYIISKSQFDANLSIIQGVNSGQNTTITQVNQYAAGAYSTANGANGLAAGAFNKANTNADNITLVQGVDLTQNTRLNSIETVNADQNTAISIIQGTDATQNVRLNSIETVNQDQNTAIAIIQGVNLGQNTTITAVNNFAQAAYNTANTKFNSAGGTISGDVAVTGNLTVTGETFYANVTNINVDDSFITLNANTVGAPVFDAGIEVDRGTGNNVVLYWNESTKKWRFENDLLEDDAIASEGFVSLAVSPINQFAQSSYNQANSANSLATTAYTTALGANGLAAGAYNLANTSIQNSGTQTLNGNLIVNGSVNTTEWSNTANAYVSNKLYAGIAPQLSTPLPDLIAQFTGNTNSYVQINAENIDPEGSADFVITADVGNDQSFYIDMGLHNSNRQFGATYPLDGYLLVQGNTGQVGGNLIIGTTSQTPGQHTKIIAGGGEESNVVIQFNDDLSTLFYGNAVPSINNSQYLGSSTKRWHSVFVGPGSVDIDNIVLSNNNGKLVISGASDIVISGSSVPSTGDISNKANNAYDKANAAFDSSNSVNQFAASAFSTANGANGLAAGAYNQANTGTSIAQSAYNFANTLSSGSATDNVARTLAQSAYDSSNLVNQFAQSAFNTANGANGLAAGAYNQANTNAGAITIIQGVDNTQNTNITSVNNFAAGAYNQANTNAGVITIIQGVDNTQNNDIIAVNNYAQSAFALANTNATNITAVNGFAQSAYATANGANGLANGAFAAANTAYSYGTQIQAIADAAYLKANAAFDSSNLVNQFAQSAYTTANGANGLAQGAYNQANTNAGAITIIQGVDNTQNTWISSNVAYIAEVDATQNTRLNSIETINLDQNTAISIIQGVDLTQNTRLNSIETVNVDQNTAISIIQGVDLGQNTTITAVNNFAQSAYNTANGANGLAAGAYNTANGANGLAQGAYNEANTKFSSSGGTITGSVTISGNNNLTVTGNLNVLGTTTTVNTNLLEVNDPMILLANGNFYSDTLDIGFSGSYNDGANAHTGLFRDAPGNKDWYFFEGYTPEVSGNNNINVADASFRTSNVNVNYLKGNLIATTAIVGGVDIRDVQNTQNTNITAVNNFAASAYNTANGANGLAQGAFNTANGANGLAQGAYNTANTNASNITIIQGVDATQNTRLNAIETINTDQNTAISIIQGVDLTQNTQIQGIQGVDLTQNSAISIIQGVDLTQNTNITAVNNFAAGAYEQANTANTRAFNTVLKSGDTMSGSLTGVTTLGVTTIQFAQTDATTNTFTTASTAQVSVDAWPTATYRSAKYFVQITSGIDYHIIELNLVHNGTTVFLAQYGEIITDTSLGAFDADISGATVRLLFTGTNAVSTVKLLRTVVNV